ncbi:MAG: translation initiation factor IF-2 subunit alpha [Candidatus Thalassarchaeaceae archaeon]|nr:translation initiation factor IF-2 subunit alpha [Candidatus Thalassarchaeaceae archaeon]
MAEQTNDWPEEGELVVCTVKNVRENGAYLSLDTYPSKEGFVFIGEIATGWVRNIRAHIREGQRVVAKVIGVRVERESISLSIKSVSEERRRGALQSWKNEQRATQIMKVAAERVGWEKGKTETVSEEMKEYFGSLYGALEECAINENALEEAGFKGPWLEVITELAIENIVPPFVEIRGVFDIRVWGPEGVGAIRDALLSAEDCVEGMEDAVLTCHYDGAPHYRVDIRAPDYPTAESLWEDAQKAAMDSMNSVEGSISIERL